MLVKENKKRKSEKAYISAKFVYRQISTESWRKRNLTWQTASQVSYTETDGHYKPETTHRNLPFFRWAVPNAGWQVTGRRGSANEAQQPIPALRNIPEGLPVWHCTSALSAAEPLIQTDTHTHTNLLLTGHELTIPLNDWTGHCGWPQAVINQPVKWPRDFHKNHWTLAPIFKLTVFEAQ